MATRGTWPACAIDPSVELIAPSASPAGNPRGWKPLLKHRRAEGNAAPDRRFNPGWARIGWTSSALVVDFAFVATTARNRAIRLNERTYLLGDVGEIFLQWLGSDRYIEIHITPENQRLQLSWDAAGLQRIRQRQAVLDDFAVADLNWVQSVTSVSPTLWSARVIVPAGTIAHGLANLESDSHLIAAVCRYDYGGKETPILSSTVDFQGSPFHTRAAWDRLVLSPAT